MNTQYQDARQTLDALIPETLKQYRFDLDLARTRQEAAEAAAKALREVKPGTPGYVELLTYAMSRVQELEEC